MGNLAKNISRITYTSFLPDCHFFKRFSFLILFIIISPVFVKLASILVCGRDLQSKQLLLANFELAPYGTINYLLPRVNNPSDDKKLGYVCTMRSLFNRVYISSKSQLGMTLLYI